MADGDAGRCEPYRVEWRYNLTERWCLLGTEATIGEAEHVAAHALHESGGQARVVEQRVVLVRGLGQDTGPDQAFMDYTRRMADLAGSVAERNERIHGPSSEPEESEQAMPDGLLFSERELWKTATVDGFIDGSDMLDVLARLARVRAELRACRGPSVVSDPDDRRDVEAAADAGQPLDQARTILNQLADTDTQRQAIREATVTDMAGCAHRMSSGAVSLTACGECGAEPGDDCMAWRVLDASDEDMTEAERVLDATAAKIDGTSPLESVMLYTATEIEALLAEHGNPHGTDPWWRRLLARIHSG